MNNPKPVASRGEVLAYSGWVRPRPYRDHVSVVCLVLGTVIYGLVFLSFVPHVVAATLYVPILLLLRLTPLGGKHELRMFNRVYCVNFLTASVSAFYRQQLDDQFQLFSDAGYFFKLAIEGHIHRQSLDQLTRLTDGASMLYLWTPVYDFFSIWGFEKLRYIGTSVNTVLVSLSAVIAVKMTKVVYGNDDYRIKRLMALISACGIFWLFSGMHVRDSAVLLSTTLLSYAFLNFVQRPTYGLRLLWLILTCYAVIGTLEYLRNEMMFIPIPMGLAMVYALRSKMQSKRLQRLATVFTVVGTLLAVGGLAVVGTRILSELSRTEATYEDAAEERSLTSSTGSLGYELIVSQPVPVRLVLGTAYAYLAPIPVWSGFTTPSVLHLFKSFNTIFNYVLLSFLLSAIWLFHKHETLRIPSIRYLFATGLGFSVAVGMTSIEARHLGAFMMMPIIFALLPDLRIKSVRRLYQNLLLLVLSIMGLIHLMWFIVKTA